MENLRSLSDYEIIKELGKGAYGTVYKVKRPIDEKIIALKVIKIESTNKKLIKITKKEIDYLKTLSKPSCNPFVICYYDSYYNPTTEEFLVEMEYIEGKDMHDFVQDMRKDNKKKVLYYYLLLIAKDVTEGLKYIHGKNIIHNDIKLENIMIDKNYVPKIIDFGLSCYDDKYEDYLGKHCKSYGGTPWYIAPEFFRLKIRTPAQDMWALGVALYVGATGKYPYSVFNDNKADLFDKIKHTEPAELKTSNRQLNFLVNGLLTKRAMNRWDADDVLLHLEQIYKPKSMTDVVVPSVVPDSKLVTPNTSQMFPLIKPNKSTSFNISSDSLIHPEFVTPPRKIYPEVSAPDQKHTNKSTSDLDISYPNFLIDSESQIHPEFVTPQRKIQTKVSVPKVSVPAPETKPTVSKQNSFQTRKLTPFEKSEIFYAMF